MSIVPKKSDAPSTPANCASIETNPSNNNTNANAQEEESSRKRKRSLDNKNDDSSCPAPLSKSIDIWGTNEPICLSRGLYHLADLELVCRATRRLFDTDKETPGDCNLGDFSHVPFDIDGVTEKMKSEGSYRHYACKLTMDENPLIFLLTEPYSYYCVIDSGYRTVASGITPSGIIALVPFNLETVVLYPPEEAAFDNDWEERTLWAFCPIEITNNDSTVYAHDPVKVGDGYATCRTVSIGENWKVTIKSPF
jgi:hypothetical protein